MVQKVLVVDDEPQIVRALHRYLTDQGYRVFSALTLGEARQIIEKESLEAMIVDLRIASQNGLDLIEEVKKKQPRATRVVMTAYGTVTTAVEAGKKGADHFLVKPFSLDEVEKVIRQNSEKRVFPSSPELKNIPKTPDRFLIGESAVMHEIHRMIEKVAPSDSTVMILGESGTGKELVARAIHAQSGRANKLMVAVNCGAIPEDLLESELFGHVKGAFTGAIQSRQGRFEMANGGTIFLDEIAEMSPKLQVKILRVLQERRFEPVGSNRTVEVDVRVLAATNKNLEQAVQEHHFREDLYYRLNVIPIQIPPLRERKEDISSLIHHFLTHSALQVKQEKPSLSKEAMNILLEYHWPGNVRELENLMERLVILARNSLITETDLKHLIHFSEKPSQGSSSSIKSSKTIFPEEGIDLEKQVNEFENQLILTALEKTGWNKNKAAKLLHLNRTTLVEKIKKRHLLPASEGLSLSD